MPTPVLDATSYGENSAETITVSHVCGGSNRFLIVGVSIADAGVVVTSGVTYGGVALTAINSQQESGARRTTLWGLINPAAGTADIVVTMSGSPSAWGRLVAASYTGALQSAQPNTSDKTGNASDTSLTLNLTTTANLCRIVGIAGGSGGQEITTGAGQAVVIKDPANEEPALIHRTADVAAGATSLSYTIPGAAAVTLVGAALAPAPVPNPPVGGATKGHFGLNWGLGITV